MLVAAMRIATNKQRPLQLRIKQIFGPVFDRAVNLTFVLDCCRCESASDEGMINALCRSMQDWKLVVTEAAMKEWQLAIQHPKTR